MSKVIRICQFFDLLTDNGNRHRYQNYFIGETRTHRGDDYEFAAFRAEGSLSSLNGDNQAMQVLFPNKGPIVRLVEAGRGNRLSTLTLYNAWLDATGRVLTDIPDFFVGTGAAFTDETVELRFRSAMDSVGATFPAQTLTTENVGVLPLNSELYLR